jgi:CO dehydrogenase/acetyl-CoA synthase gamma subunit (corrinoid Fe-S protein)
MKMNDVIVLLDMPHSDSIIPALRVALRAAARVEPRRPQSVDPG